MDNMNAYARDFQVASAKQLQAERAASGLTYKEVAERAGLTEQSVMRYMRGQRDIPISAFAAMSEALGLAPDEMIERAIKRL